MTNLRLLIIEDEAPIIKEWEEKIDFYNVEEKRIYNILPQYCSSLSEATELLNNQIFDVAVIDIRLKNEGASDANNKNTDGNELYLKITESTLAVTAIYTGEPKVVELPESQQEFTKVFTKGDGIIPIILTWIETHEKMISSIQVMQQSIHQEMAKLFSKSIWPRWAYWMKDNLDQTFTANALKRHMATHLHANFLNEANQHVHPEEYFFIPPLNNQLDTGDIFYSKDNGFSILVTPRCELAQEKNDSYQTVQLEDVREEWEKRLNKIDSSENEDKKRSATESFRSFTNHKGNTSSRHFIPELRLSGDEGAGPFFARFDHLYTIKKSDSEKLKEQRIASLSNEFIPSLVERLGNFFSRIGDPDYSHPS